MSYPAYVYQEVLKQFPHVVTCVDLLHFNLSVNIAVVQEVDVGNFHLQKRRSDLTNLLSLVHKVA